MACGDLQDKKKEKPLYLQKTLRVNLEYLAQIRLDNRDRTSWHQYLTSSEYFIGIRRLIINHLLGSPQLPTFFSEPHGEHGSGCDDPGDTQSQHVVP